jgi:hypothetical protein
LRNIFNSALTSFFRNSGRIVAVMVRWEEINVFASNEGLLIYKFKTYLNDTSRNLTENVRELIKELTRTCADNWTRFRDLVSNCLTNQ